MLTRPQQILLKRAQREAGLSDSEYRDALAAVSGCRSSTDPKLTDRHLDKALAYLEAIAWRGFDSGQLQMPCKANAVFRQRHFWQQRNTNAQTTRDRFTREKLGAEIAELEAALMELGVSPEYCAGILNRSSGDCQPGSLAQAKNYRSALRRTLKVKRKALACA